MEPYKVNSKTFYKGTVHERTEYRNEKGYYHREDGPAIEFDNGEEQWWINGKQYTEEEHTQELYRRNLKKLNETT